MGVKEVARNYLADEQTLEDLRGSVSSGASSAKGAEADLCEDIVSVLAFLDHGHTSLPQFRSWLGAQVS